MAAVWARGGQGSELKGFLLACTRERGKTEHEKDPGARTHLRTRGAGEDCHSRRAREDAALSLLSLAAGNVAPGASFACRWASDWICSKVQ